MRAPNGCAGEPDNLLTWQDTGADVYYLYRTITPDKPSGRRASAILNGGNETTWHDSNLSPVVRVIYPDGNPGEAPKGEGPYLVGTSAGEPIIDTGVLTRIAIYNMNTTDPKAGRVVYNVPGFEPQPADHGGVQINSDFREPSQKQTWSHFNSLYLHQRNIAGGVNVYPHNWQVDKETAKNTYNGIDIHQFNYTPGQHSPYLTFMYNYSVGDNVFMHMAMEQQGQNRTPGDEGSEFFSFHMNRRLAMNRTKLQATAQVGDTLLKVDRSIGTVAGGRGIVNLTRKYTAGAARVHGGNTVIGTGTDWTPDMEGRWISFDADTTKKGIRQWYLIERFISPTELKIYAYTYWSRSAYKGSARSDGGYMICPYTEMADGDAVTSRGLKVIPLTCDWQEGDEIEAIAGPQTTMRLGWWEMGGEFLPQDHVAGLGIAYNGDKPTNEGALITYNWGTGLEVHNGNTGMVLYNTKQGIRAHKESPVLISVIRDDPYRFQLAQNKDGFVIEDHARRPWVSLGVKGIALHGNSTIAGSARTRGKSIFSGDGKTAEFSIAFPAEFATEPFVVASSNLPIGMGVTRVTPKGCTITFATPPPAGKDNVTVTWMVQE